MPYYTIAWLAVILAKYPNAHEPGAGSETTTTFIFNFR